MVTADPNEVTTRPDRTTLIVGDSGDPLPQGSGGELQTIRGTVAREDASLEFDQDLVGEGDVVFGPQDVSGTDALSGSVVSDDSNNLEVRVRYEDGNGNKRGVEQTFGPDTVIEFVNIAHRFDIIRVTITDTSGAAQNNVTGSVYVV
jgi:hypothetical protein